MLPAIVMTFVTLFFRTWRWSVLMNGARFWTTFHAQNIGYMLNMILPLRIGEVGRAYVMGERGGISVIRALSSILVERLVDLASVVLLFAICAQFIPMNATFTNAAALAGVLVVGMIAVLLILLWQSERVEQLIVALARRFPRLHAESLLKRFHDVRDGFRVMQDMRNAAIIVFSTIMVWLSAIAVAYFAMGIFMPPYFDRAALVTVMANLGGALPSAPGGLGVVQYFANQALVIPFNVDPTKAVAFAFVWPLFQQILLIVLGLFGLTRLGLQFSAVSHTTQSSEVTEPVAHH